AVGLALADMDGDGHLDALVSQSNNTFSLLHGDGHGTLGTQVNYTGLGVVAASDLDGDGDLDVLGQANDLLNDAHDAGYMLSVLGGFTPAVFPFNLAGIPVPGDVDADGDPDFVVARPADASVSIGLGNGAPGFSLLGEFLAGGNLVGARITDL